MQLAVRLAATLSAIASIAPAAQAAAALRDFPLIDGARDPFPAPTLISDRGRLPRGSSTTSLRIPAGPTAIELKETFAPCLIDTCLHVAATLSREATYAKLPFVESSSR